MARVLILLGSKSDMEYAEQCRTQLEVFGLTGDIIVSSAHRHPEQTARLASDAEGKGYDVIVAMAGLSAALPGMCAAHSNLPVIGVPIPAALDGLDALLSVTQMPPGIPVAGVAIGTPGAKNAAVLAARIIGRRDEAVRKAHEAFRRQL